MNAKYDEVKKEKFSALEKHKRASEEIDDLKNQWEENKKVE